MSIKNKISFYLHLCSVFMVLSVCGLYQLPNIVVVNKVPSEGRESKLQSVVCEEYFHPTFESLSFFLQFGILIFFSILYLIYTWNKHDPLSGEIEREFFLKPQVSHVLQANYYSEAKKENLGKKYFCVFIYMFFLYSDSLKPQIKPQSSKR